SSRRRHTRSKRDWSSDVCSSDLGSVHGPWNVTENGASASPPTVINRYDVSLVISVVIGVNTGATMPPKDFGTTDTDTSDESAARSEERRVGKEVRPPGGTK